MRERTPPVREIAWRDVCPWLLIFEAAGAAFEVRKTLIASLGLTLTLLGWWAFSAALLDQPTTFGQLVDGRLSAAVETTQNVEVFAPSALATANPLFDAWRTLSAPFKALFVGRPTWSVFIFSALCGLWGLLVWAFFGAVIGRMSAMQLGREEPASVHDGVRHARAKYWDYATGPLVPLGGAVVLLIGVALGGWLLRSDAGTVVAGLLAGPALLLGWFAALLLVAVLVGWPLMWSAIGVERCDNFGSFSTAYSFLSQRPVHAALYVALAAAIGAFLTYLVAQLAALAVSLSFYAAGWTSGAEAVADLKAALPPSARAMATALDATQFVPANAQLTSSKSGTLGATLVAFWSQLLALTVAGFGLNYLFTTATAIYLVLRYDVDRTEFDRIDVDKPAKPERVPPAPPAPAGLPIVQLEAKRP